MQLHNNFIKRVLILFKYDLLYLRNKYFRVFKHLIWYFLRICYDHVQVDKADVLFL